MWDLFAFSACGGSQSGCQDCFQKKTTTTNQAILMAVFVLAINLQPWSKRLGTLEEIRHKDALC